MEIHSDSDTNLFLDASYDAKQLLVDSVARTIDGYHSICEGEVLTGIAQILLARIESAVAFTFVALSGTIISVGNLLLAPMVIVPLGGLNVISRVFPALHEMRDYSCDVISRLVNLNLVAIPSISLFVIAAGVNFIVPGILKSDSLIFSTIHNLVEGLGPLQRIHAVVPGIKEATGTEHSLSLIEISEEYLRSLSNQNEIQDVVVSNYRYCYSFGYSQRY